MGTEIRRAIEAAARARRIDLAGDPEAMWCAGVLQSAPIEAAQAVVARRCPFRILELADALHLDPDSLNEVYSEWILNGGTGPATLPGWAFDKNETRPWKSDIGPPGDRGFGGFSTPVGDPVRLAPTPRVRAPSSGLRSWGSLIFISYVVLGLIALAINLSGGNSGPSMPDGVLLPQHARESLPPLFPNAVASQDARRNTQPPAR